MTMSSYNEEIAERNLDTKISRGEQYYAYVPTSKFQEEVALRNSYQSLDLPRASEDKQHRSWVSSGTDSSKANTPHTSWLQDNSRPTSKMPPPPATQTQPTRQQTHSAPLSSHPIVASPVNGSTLDGYHLSKAEVSQPRRPESAQQQYTDRSSSRMSTTSSITPVINLPGRTIMDLTAEEELEAVELDVKRNSGMQLAERAHLVDIRTPSKEKVPQVPSSAEDIMATEGSGTITPTPARVAAQAEQPLTTPERKRPISSFSMVNTVASFSPSVKTEQQPTVEDEVYETSSESQQRPEESAPRPTSVRSFHDQVTEPVMKPVPPNSQLAPHQAQTLKNRLSTVAETDWDSEGFDTAVETPSEIPQKQVLNGVPEEPKEVLEEVPAPLEEPAPPQLSTQTPSAAVKNIHSSPESLQSVDYINPSAAFGVRARDFAVTPSKPAVSSATEDMSTSKIKATTIEPHPVKAPKARTVSPPYAFDEEGFKRKQEQARAALIKLQQSLNEDFLPPPRTQSAPRQNRMNGVGQRRVQMTRTSTDPHGPVAPTAMFQLPNGVEDRGRTRPSISSAHVRGINIPHESNTSGTRHRDRHSRQPLQQSQPTASSRTRSDLGKGKGKEREIDAALFDLQRTAEEITATRLPIQHPPRSPLRERKGGSNSQGIFGYGFGQEGNKPNGVVQTPTSPGEVSLSSFPIAPSPDHARTNSLQSKPRGYVALHGRGESAASDADPFVDRVGGVMAGALKRRSSTTSQASQMTSASQYSIPFHMIPERGSSMRDSSVKEESVAG